MCSSAARNPVCSGTAAPKHGGMQLALCLYAGQAGVEGERKWYFGTILFFLKKSLLNARPNSGMDINIPLMNGIFASRDTFGLH